MTKQEAIDIISAQGHTFIDAESAQEIINTLNLGMQLTEDQLKNGVAVRDIYIFCMKQVITILFG